MLQGSDGSADQSEHPPSGSFQTWLRSRSSWQLPQFEQPPRHPALADVTARFFMGQHREADKGMISGKNNPAKRDCGALL